MNYQILIYVKTIVRNVISHNVQINRKLLSTICVLFKTYVRANVFISTHKKGSVLPNAESPQFPLMPLGI